MKISEVTDFLEKAYDILNEKYFEGSLSRVCITVQSSVKTYGHYTPWDSWAENNSKGLREINISAEYLTEGGINSNVSVLLHEMTHHYCAMNGIKDTSRNGRYHNKRFKEEAEKRGIIISYDPSIGWSPTEPSEGLKEFIREQGWADIDLSRGIIEKPTKKGNSRKYACPSCGAIVRATKEVNVICGDCGVPFVEVGPGRSNIAA